MKFETGRRLLLLLQEMQGRAYTPFAARSHEEAWRLFVRRPQSTDPGPAGTRTATAKAA
jgi:hypothetical protein